MLIHDVCIAAVVLDGDGAIILLMDGARLLGSLSADQRTQFAARKVVRQTAPFSCGEHGSP